MIIKAFAALTLLVLCISCSMTETGVRAASNSAEPVIDLGSIKTFGVKENRLVAEAGTARDGSASLLVGPVWQWAHTIYEDGRRFVPPEPKNYTVQFLEAGTLSVNADCNKKGGVYSVKENRLSIEITHSTRAACPEGSLEDQFVRDLTAGAIFFLKDGDLSIDLKYDSGRMRLFTEKRTQAR